MKHLKEITRPKLTLPAAEGAAVSEYYGKAETILEYGSGGSTVTAAEMPGKVIFSVESDIDWLNRMNRYFELHPPISTVKMIHGDIGATKAWGYPVDTTRIKDWHQYPLGAWSSEGFSHPDVVLVDGRFRAACFLTALFRITRPITLLWDDYVNRPDYHDVEFFSKPREFIGRMARFELQPTTVPTERLSWLISKYLNPH